MSETPKKYQYVKFVERSRTTKTICWSCRNIRSDAELGIVKWYAPWRRYCYFPLCQAVYSVGCLADIQDFIENAMDARRKTG